MVITSYPEFNSQQLLLFDYHFNYSCVYVCRKNVVYNYTDTEVKVREATSNDPWGPASTLMAEISELTYNT